MERNYPEIIISDEGVTWLDKGQMWMYKNNLEQCDPQIKNGELVDIVTNKGRYLGTGFISLKSHITVRILSKDRKEIIDREFFKKRIQQAYDFRKTVEGDNLSNCRLIFGEADLLPGLVIDRYNDILVSQISSYGLEQIKDMIYEIVLDVLKADGEDVKGIYERNDIQIRTKEGLEQYKGYYIGRYTVGDEQSTKNKTLRQSDSLITNNATIKAGQAPFTWITYAQAKEIAEKFGLNNKYKTTTKLTNSYAWDTAIAFIEKNNRNYGSSSEEGNYINTTFTYTDISDSKVTKPINTSTIVPTGQTTAVCNIYDMGGNVQEWSTENIISEKNFHTIRGGDSQYEYAVWGAGNRNAAYDEKTFENVGFRITMYM